MRRWTRKSGRVTCGGCGHPVYPQQPVLEITVPPLARMLLRCVACAGEPVPDDLPVQPLVQPRALGTQPVRKLAQDWKQKAAGEGV